MKTGKSTKSNRGGRGNRGSAPPPLPKQITYPVGEALSREIDEAFAAQDAMDRLEAMMRRGPFPSEILAKH